MDERGLIGAARDWICDCAWANLDAEDAEDLRDAQVKRGVARHYGGGWKQFLADCGQTADSEQANKPRSRLSALAA